MQTVQSPSFGPYGDLIPLSCKGQWQKKHFNTSKVDRNTAIKNLSYELLSNFASDIFKDEKRWKNWKTYISCEFRRLKVYKIPTWGLFVQSMMKRDCKIQYLYNVAKRLRDDSYLEKWFYPKEISQEDVTLEKNRIQASLDVTRGYFRDILYESLIEIDKLLNEESHWRKMGDGLGFSFSECFDFLVPIEMFEEWLLKCKDGTVSVIYFEAKRLGFNKICKYLDEIPLESVELKHDRMQASLDSSRGYFRDVSHQTLLEIDDLFGNDSHWRKMGTSLGFNLSECFNFSDPFEMFEKWRLKCKDGTVSAIYFEAKRLGFNHVCKHLERISLNKRDEFIPRDPHIFHPELRVVTAFDLEKLDKVYEASGVEIDWTAVSHLLFNSFDSAKEDLWLSGDVNLLQLQTVMNLRHVASLSCFDQFMKEIQSGAFQPHSINGVTYNQMAFMAEVINSDTQITEACFAELMDKDISACTFRVKELSIRDLLSIYWQINREFTLTQVYQHIFNVLNPVTPSTAKILSYAYDLLCPKRYVTPDK